MKSTIQIIILALLVVAGVQAKSFEEKKEECWKHNKSPYCDEITSDNKLSLLENSQSCESGNPIGCWHVGVAYARGTAEVKKDMDLARKYYVKSCELGNTRMCVFVSKMYLQKSLNEYKEGCDIGLQRGCKGVDFAKSFVGQLTK